MRTAVVYASRSGNTRFIAQAIGESLNQTGEVIVMPVETAELPPGTEVLIVGGPTEGHRMTPVVQAFIERLPTLSGVRVAAFDTRLNWPLWLSGSAAKGIADALCSAGGTLIAPPESFLVTKEPKLYQGEVERARTWALALVSPVRATV
jgi:flavodoxin